MGLCTMEADSTHRSKARGEPEIGRCSNVMAAYLQVSVLACYTDHIFLAFLFGFISLQHDVAHAQARGPDDGHA